MELVITFVKRESRMITKVPSSTRTAIFYQSLYLANLLLLPGICFFILLWLFYQHHYQTHWQKIHLIRALQLSITAGIAIVIIPLIVVLFSTQFSKSVMIMLFYIITFHAGFVLIGMLNLSRAMAKKLPIF